MSAERGEDLNGCASGGASQGRIQMTIQIVSANLPHTAVTSTSHGIHGHSAQLVKLSKEGVRKLSKMNRWIVGLTIVALLALGGVALASGGFGGRSVENASECPQALDGRVCVAGDELCPQDGTGCDEGGGACLGLSSDRPLDGTGARCGVEQVAGRCGRF